MVGSGRHTLCRQRSGTGPRRSRAVFQHTAPRASAVLCTRPIAPPPDSLNPTCYRDPDMTPIHRNVSAAPATPAPDQSASRPVHAHTGARASGTLQAVVSAGTQDMLNAAHLEDVLNRTQAFAKLMEAGPKAAKDLLV